MRLNSGFPTFKEVVGFESTHVVSNYGEVVRKAKVIVDELGRVRRFKARVLRPTRNVYGYFHITLTGENGKEATVLLHKLVLEAFVSAKPEGMESLHIDGDQSNNQVSNLRWGTHLENCADRSRHGTSGSVLDFSQAQQIRALKGKHTQKEIARMFGVTQCTVSQIQRRVIWNVAPEGVVA